MNFGYTLDGSTIIKKRYRVGSGVTFSAAGVPALNIAATTSGLAIGTTTSAANAVGVSLDTATGTTTPTSDAQTLLSVIVNPLAVYKLRICGSATAGTQALIMTESAGGSKTANTITTGDAAPNSPTMDEGTIACVYGANLGQVRKVTSVSATVATITEGWVNNNASGDVFIVVPWTPVDVAGNNIQLTTNLTEADQSIAVGTGAEFRIVELEFDFGGVEAARRNSFVYGMFDDHIFGVTT